MSGDAIPHVVCAGEHLDSIAHRYGVNADDIWGLPQNAKLVSLRKTGNVLASGDVIFVPQPKRQFLSVPVGSTTQFVATVPVVKVRAQLSDEAGPIANEPYIAQGERTKVSGTTDAQGWMSFKASIVDHVIKVTLTQRKHDLTLHVGGLDPVETITGLQTRLYHGGYLRWPNGAIDSATEEALRAFQKDAGLEPTGALNDATADALRARFGC